MPHRTLVIGLMMLNIALALAGWSFQIAAILHAPGAWRLVGVVTVLLLLLAGPLISAIPDGNASGRPLRLRKWFGIRWTEWVGLLATPIVCLPMLWAELLAPPFWAALGVTGFVALLVVTPISWIVRSIRGGKY